MSYTYIRVSIAMSGSNRTRRSASPPVLGPSFDAGRLYSKKSHTAAKGSVEKILLKSALRKRVVFCFFGAVKTGLMGGGGGDMLRIP